MLKSKGLWGPPRSLREKDEDLPFPIDNVYFAKDYAYKRYTINEAVESLKCLCHPSMMNEPDALIYVKIEFDMRGNKRDRFIDAFTKTAPIVRPYDRNVPDRQVACFVPNEEMRLQALQDGAIMAGGADLVMDISRGRVDVAEIDHFLCHSDLFDNMKLLKAVIRDKTPHLGNGTIGTDMTRMIQTFGQGIQLNVVKAKAQPGYMDEPDYGSCVGTIGRLNMSIEDLTANLDVVLEVLRENKPKRKDGSGFITRVMLYCLPNQVTTMPKYYHFSIIHPSIDDTRVEEQIKVQQEGKELILKNVEKLRSEW